MRTLDLLSVTLPPAGTKIPPPVTTDLLSVTSVRTSEVVPALTSPPPAALAVVLAEIVLWMTRVV